MRKLILLSFLFLFTNSYVNADCRVDCSKKFTYDKNCRRDPNCMRTTSDLLMGCIQNCQNYK